MKYLKSNPAILLLVIFSSLSLLTYTQVLTAHCQIPCGIYNDHARVQSMLEDAATVEKATQLIGALSSKNDPQSRNQLTRWVNNKETHAQKIIETMCDYFLTQRVKPSMKDYTDRLVKHHTVILSAMKAKQKSDAKTAQALKTSIEALQTYYPKK